VYYYAARSTLTNDEVVTEDGTIPPGTLGVTLCRSLDTGLHEDIDIANYGPAKVRFNLEIVIRSDFADLFEVKAGRIVRRGRVGTERSPTARVLHGRRSENETRFGGRAQGARLQRRGCPDFCSRGGINPQFPARAN
jgi:hypothetical protein